MEVIEVETKNGIQEEIVYNVRDFPYMEVDSALYLNKIKNVQYYNIFGTFDIESTTIIPDEYLIGNRGESPYGFMYHWQFCIGENVVFGRYWHEFRYFLYRLNKYLLLNKKRRFVIFVHFLSFEFQFISQIVHFDEIFATEKRKVLVARSGGLEFRCSYRLSNKSLQKFCEDTPDAIHYKLSGEMYDYKKIRTPETIMSTQEKGYCYNDVRGLWECISNLLRDDTISTLPLTSTGFVRRDVRKHCQDYNYRRMFMQLELNKPIYNILRDAFRGGNCHANPFFTGRVVKNVKSKDKQSSYPASMISGYYPMGPFTQVWVHELSELKKYLNKYCCVFRICFENLRTKEFVPVPYLDLGHALKRSGISVDNGRILSADYLLVAMTEIDFAIVERQYYFDACVIEEMYVSNRNHLPEQILTVMMDYFLKKTTLKGVNGMEYFYIKSKNNLNAFYGMMCTSIAHIIYGYDFDTCEWTEEEEDVVQKLIEFYQSRSNFLSYAWGVYVTAHARKELQYGLDIVGNDLVYCDTDSVKYVGEHEHEFEMLNERIISQMQHAIVPGFVNYNGKDYILGVWEDEEIAEEFKTFGAKKYAGVYNGKFKLTVSGMNKAKGSEVVHDMDNFKLGSTYKNVGRTVSFYNDCKKHYRTVNECRFLTAGNIGVVDTTYTLGITNEYGEYLQRIEIEGIAKLD